MRILPCNKSFASSSFFGKIIAMEYWNVPITARKLEIDRKIPNSP
jgi:hypothetical protein